MDETKVQIIQLPIENWQEYKDLRLLALQTDPQAFDEPYSRPSLWDDEKWQRRLREANEGKTSCMLFARLERKLIGMVGFYRNEDDLASHTAQIWGVYVDPQKRGQGVAKSLFTEILKVLTNNPDIATVKLQVNTDQPIAKKLYESFGFTVTTTSQIQLGDSQTHQVSIMTKQIHP